MEFYYMINQELVVSQKKDTIHKRIKGDELALCGADARYVRLPQGANGSPACVICFSRESYDYVQLSIVEEQPEPPEIAWEDKILWK